MDRLSHFVQVPKLCMTTRSAVRLWNMFQQMFQQNDKRQGRKPGSLLIACWIPSQSVKLMGLQKEFCRC